jgi:murein DD-endopeptidase MepM/ murein hydrolase activator NlpD
MTVSSPFGWRSNRLHTGVDLTMPEGEPIRAAESGLVTFSNVEGAYGNVVAIDHGAGYTTRYAHAQTLLVNEGQWVIKGQPIATVGSTGNATGAHLHFELLHDRDHQDPIPLLNQPFTVAKSPLAPH